MTYQPYRQPRSRQGVVGASILVVLALAVTAAVVIALTGPRGDSGAARDAYAACEDSDSLGLMSVHGSEVRVALTDEQSEAISGAGDELDDTVAGDPGDGTRAALGLVVVTECLADATGYPGDTDHLVHGASWDGWRYVVRSETESAFVAR